LRRSARLPNDSEDEGVISLSACKKFRKCKTRVGCAGVFGNSGDVNGDDSLSETWLSSGCSADKVDVDDEASLSRVAAGAIGSKSEDGKDSSFVKYLSNCCCDDELVIDGEDSRLMAGNGEINASEEDVDKDESPSIAAAGVFSDSDGGGEFVMRGSDFQGSSTCSLTESKAADTQRSEIKRIKDGKSYRNQMVLRLRSEPEKLSVLAASTSTVTSAARLSSRSRILRISGKHISRKSVLS
jgi:hypothetical protein